MFEWRLFAARSVHSGAVIRKLHMNPERVPYAAIADLESVVKTIAKESKGRVLIFYDPEKGWWAGDEIDEAMVDSRSGALALKGRTYTDWRRDNIAEALSALAAARFIPGNEVTKLFRRAPPAAPVTKQESPGAGAGQALAAGAATASTGKKAPKSADQDKR